MEPPKPFDGPTIQGRPTSIALFSPEQLEKPPLVPSLCRMINEAFRFQKHRDIGPDFIPRSRLRYDGQLFDELKSATGAFTFVLYYTGTNDVCATAGGKKYMGSTIEFDINSLVLKMESNTWKRFDPLPDNAAVWELSLMAVDSELQGQGIAAVLMRLVEDEMKVRFKNEFGEGCGKQLLMYCTTIKEVNGHFYAKRGFETTYEVPHPKGHLQSAHGFTVSHMSKAIEV